MRSQSCREPCLASQSPNAPETFVGQTLAVQLDDLFTCSLVTKLLTLQELVTGKHPGKWLYSALPIFSPVNPWVTHPYATPGLASSKNLTRGSETCKDKL